MERKRKGGRNAEVEDELEREREKEIHDETDREINREIEDEIEGWRMKYRERQIEGCSRGCWAVFLTTLQQRTKLLYTCARRP